VARGLHDQQRLLLRHRRHRARRARALRAHRRSLAGSTDPHTAGNGSLSRALAGASKADALLGDTDVSGAPKVAAIARGDWRDKSDRHIRGTGYIVDSLEAALWSVWATDSFEAAILRAANLGDDADTTAAVAGQVAGALYGKAGIPARWLDRLAMRDVIEDLGASLAARTDSLT
jgi:ADP-ribosyl-[dinitrogen reductase] hydrolase